MIEVGSPSIPQATHAASQYKQYLRKVQYHYGYFSSGCFAASESTASPLRNEESDTCLYIENGELVNSNACTDQWYLDQGGSHGLSRAKHALLRGGSKSTRFHGQPVVPGPSELQPTGWWSCQRTDFPHQQPGPFAQRQVGCGEFECVPEDPRKYHWKLSRLCRLWRLILLQGRDCLVLWWRWLSIQPVCQEHVFSPSVDSRFGKFRL